MEDKGLIIIGQAKRSRRIDLSFLKHPLVILVATSLWTGFLIPAIQGKIQEKERYNQVYSGIIDVSMDYISKASNVVDIYERQISSPEQVTKIMDEYNQASTVFLKSMMLLQISNEAFYKRHFRRDKIDEILGCRTQIESRIQLAEQVFALQNSFANREILQAIKEIKAILTLSLRDSLLQLTG